MSRHFYLVLCVVCMLYASAFSAPLRPLDASCVKISESWLKNRERLNSSFMDSIDTDRLLHNFRINAGLPSSTAPLGGWEAPNIGLRGHFVGHYISALSQRYKNSGDQNVKQKLDYMVNALKECQDAMGTGCLTAFPESDFDTLESKCAGVWAPYYTYHKMMQGLYDAYTLTGNETAYAILLKMADYVDRRMSRLNQSEIERLLDTTAANPANETGAMNEILYKVYALTGDRKYLSLARKFDPEWFLTAMSGNDDILAGLHSNTHLVLVNGFAAAYNATGDTVYRNAARNFWNMLSRDHSYVNGSSSGPRPNPTTRTSVTAEHWTYPGCLSCTFSKEIAESCVSHNTRKLLSYLFQWTGDPSYAEADMNLFYNAVLPIQSGAGDYVYHLPLGSPRQKKYLKKDDFFCCSGSSTEAYAQLYQGAYYHDGGRNLWVNLYIPSEIRWNGAVIAQETQFPCDSVVRFTISGKPGTFALNLLDPSWAEGVKVTVNGETVPVESVDGSGYIKLERKWRKGDVVEMTLPSSVRVNPLPGNDKVVAFSDGAIVLAFEGNNEVALKGKPEDIAKGIVLKDRTHQVYSLRNNGMDHTLRPFYMIDRQSYSVYATIKD